MSKRNGDLRSLIKEVNGRKNNPKKLIYNKNSYTHSL